MDNSEVLSSVVAGIFFGIQIVLFFALYFVHTEIRKNRAFSNKIHQKQASLDRDIEKLKAELIKRPDARVLRLVKDDDSSA